jgi:hypothetical protein
MANSKISALPAATTPLAGTETLPVVQGGITEQVSVANLTAGRAVSAASLTLTTTPLPATSGGTGLSSFTLNGVPYANTTTTLTTGSGLTFDGTNFVAGIFSVGSTSATIASGGIAGVRNAFDISASGNGGAGRGTSFRIFAPGSSSAVAVARVVGYQTTASATANNASLTLEVANSSGTLTEYLKISNAGDVTVNVGNVVQGTAAKGFNFTANTPAAGMTSQLLNWYEEGTWTPNQGAGLTLVGAFSSTGRYTRIGRQVSISGTVTGATSVAVTAAGVITSNLPFTVVTAGHGGATNVANNASATVICISTNVTSAAAIAATATITFSATYFV